MSQADTIILKDVKIRFPHIFELRELLEYLEPIEIKGKFGATLELEPRHIEQVREPEQIVIHLQKVGRTIELYDATGKRVCRRNIEGERLVRLCELHISKRIEQEWRERMRLPSTLRNASFGKIGVPREYPHSI